MKFLTDQDIYGGTIRFLRGVGHDVVTAADRGWSRAADTELLQHAHEMQCIFVTRDRDYGSLVFSQGRAAGVIYLRMSPSTQEAVHAELARVLSLYGEAVLRSAFVVVEPGRHRMRRLPEAAGGGER